MTIAQNTYRYARRHEQPWTPEEDARLYDGTTRAVAVALGRTQVSVMLRRRRTRPQPPPEPMTEWERNRAHEDCTYRGA